MKSLAEKDLYCETGVSVDLLMGWLETDLCLQLFLALPLLSRHSADEHTATEELDQS